MKLASVLASFWLLCASPAWAYNLGSGVTDPCHEELTLSSSDELLLALQDQATLPAAPESELWQRAADNLFSILPKEADPGSQAPERRFVAFSLLVGARYPDTGARATSSPNALRRIHSAADPDAQHIHCLRAANDDGPRADQEVLAAARSLLREELTLAANAFSDGASDARLDLSLYFEFSGQVEVEVHEGAFHLGVALHLLQDSFSHTLRTDDGTQILAVLNFVDAASGDIHEERDGIAHSRAMDQCHDPSLAPLVDLAERTSRAVTRATIALSRGDDTLLERGLAPCTGPNGIDCGWLRYSADCEQILDESGSLKGSCCSDESDHCGTRFSQKVREGPTQPWPRDVLGCSQTRGPSGKNSGLAGLLVLLLLTTSRKRWWRWGRRDVLTLWVFASLAGSPDAHAASQNEPSSDPYLAVETHGSLLAGQAARALPDVSFGFGFRAGVQPRGGPGIRLGVFGLVEQSNLLMTETTTRVVPGLLHLGAGIDVAYFDVLRGSLTAGPSMLLTDTVAHEAPQLGLFVDIHPLGFRFPLGRHFKLTLDPLTLNWTAPALSEPMVSWLRYRLVLGIEWLP